MEYLQVFDKEKKMLNEKVARDNKLDLPDGKYFMIVLIFIENSEGKFLFQKTSKERNSCIATTGGHVTFGDDGLKTAVKEVKEELGVTLDASELSFVDTFIYSKGYLETYYVKKDIDINSITVQTEEVEYVKWYSVDEIKEFIDKGELRKGNIEPFKKLLEYKASI